ncbi:alpha/beta hydrolase [Coralliovum pocilloporae]|uniref:alpha/beta hydrolase n=1 Tax=Coralliovum pocilloporae TaxID=3066369 RepID=UPI003307582E
MSELDELILEPVSGGEPASLVVLLHGYGADGNDLISLGRDWCMKFPDTMFVAPNAPEACEDGPYGYQWFPLHDRSPEQLWAGVCHAQDRLDSYLDDLLKRQGVEDANMALVGFSQGTMMALHNGLRRAASPAGILGYSGRLAGAGKLPEAVDTAIPVSLVHGDQDDVVPLGAMFETSNALQAAGLQCEWHIARGTGHDIDDDGIALGERFLRRVLAG